MSAEQSEKVAQVVGITGVSEQMATQILQSNDWEVDQAVAMYYESLEGGAEEPEEEDDDEHPISQQPNTSQSNLMGGGGRRLGDDSSSSVPASAAPIATGSSRPKASSKPKTNSKFGSLRDLQAGQDDDDDEDKDQEFYAGGDKSGLAVQEPNSGHGHGQGQHADPVRRLLETARRNGPPPAREEDQRNNFSGQGQTLGGDDTPSQIIPDPTAASRRPAPMVERTLHLWEDGFSIDDGPLFRYDDPRNRHTLEMINRGSAPLDLMDVEPGQAVDVRLDEHRGEKYVQPKKKWKPFSGSGQRLGSPVPGDGGPSRAPGTTAPAVSSSSSAPSTMQVDDAQPTLSLQIRLADGSRLPSRFNTTHTIGDVYDFVNRANAGSAGRAYVLATTFPTKDLTDKSQVLGELAEFKRGGVVVQKWQ